MTNDTIEASYKYGMVKQQTVTISLYKQNDFCESIVLKIYFCDAQILKCSILLKKIWNYNTIKL